MKILPICTFFLKNHLNNTYAILYFKVPLHCALGDLCDCWWWQYVCTSSDMVVLFDEKVTTAFCNKASYYIPVRWRSSLLLVSEEVSCAVNLNPQTKNKKYQKPFHKFCCRRIDLAVIFNDNFHISFTYPSNRYVVVFTRII